VNQGGTASSCAANNVLCCCPDRCATSPDMAASCYACSPKAHENTSDTPIIASPCGQQTTASPVEDTWWWFPPPVWVAPTLEMQKVFSTVWSITIQTSREVPTPPPETLFLISH